MAKKQPKSLFRRLTRLFRSGPIVKRKIRALDTTIAIADKTKSSGTLLFQKSLSPTYATITSNAYNLSERLMRYQDFQEMEYSLAIDTPIATPDGFKTIGELADECSADPAKTFIVYAYDHNKKQVIPALAKQARQTCVDHAWKITFDNGKSITASPEHRLMLRDGTYRKVEDLQPGDAMMPFYRKDLFANAEEGTKGYSWIYTMNEKFRGWTKEHQLIAEWIAERELTEDECVHHINFIKTDNRPENLRIMSKSDHNSYHATLNNKVKWSPENHEWIEKFKKNHAEWMRDSAPTQRRDVTFAKILETAERVGFSMPAISSALDVTWTLIYERLVLNGFANFDQFVQAYKSGQVNTTLENGKAGLLTRDLSLELLRLTMTSDDTKRSLCIKLNCTVNVLDKFLCRRARVSWTELRTSLGFDDASIVTCKSKSVRKGGRPRGSNGNALTFKQVCDAYEPGLTLPRLTEKLGVNKNTIISRLAQNGHKKYSDFASTYQNCKVVSIEYVGEMPLYDLTVDGYKNFATDSVISHNTPEIAAALDIYCLAPETIVPLLDGTRPTVKELYDANRESFGVYSFDNETCKFVPGDCARVIKTGLNQQLFRVSFDDGTSVRLTENHQVLLTDGTYKRVCELIANDSIRSLYMKISSTVDGDKLNGYEQIKTSSGWKYTHRIIAEYANVGAKGVVHHIDFNKRNNNPSNLRFMTRGDHQQLHANMNSFKWSTDLEYREKMSKIFSEHAKRMHSDPVWQRSFLARRNDVFASYSIETRREKFGRRDEQNGTWKDVPIAWILAEGTKYKSLNEFVASWDTDLFTNVASKKQFLMRRFQKAGYAGWREYKKKYVHVNHKVASVVADGYDDVFDLQVDKWHNFAIACEPTASNCVIVHNSDETCAQDEKGRVIHVYSDNEKIRELLEDLFYNVLNIEFNLRSWARNLPVHKDTVIPLLDGRNITIEQLAQEHEEGKQNWVYSVQDKTLRTVPGKVAWCGLTRKDSELVRVWLDDDTYVDCTPDHEFKLRDGSSKQAHYLTEGESLMPFYRKTSSREEGAAMDGYEEVYDSSSGRFVYTHRRVAEVLEEGTLKEGRWLVTHHKDFDKRNNDPQNLVRMDEKEHMDLHRQLAIEKLHSPEVTAKRMAGIDRWLRSDEHRVIAKEQLKTLQAKGLMKTSWVDYNSSPQAKHDNVKRSRLKKEMWADNTRRAQAQANMAIKFDQHCVDMVVVALATHGKYVSPKVLGNQLKADEAFMCHFKTINEGTKRDLTKSLNSHTGFENLLQKAGVSSYIELVKDRLPTIAMTPWFIRAEKKSQKMSGVVPTMREMHSSSKPVYKNHKVARVERLEETSDVYCMEVLGPEGEHDRHNFMVLGSSNDGKSSINSGICLENCKYGDFFLYNDVSPEYGVINAFPIPVNEIEREENYDRDDPFAVRYRWVTLGNRTLENWEVTHFRLLGNDMFLPYGSSIIEPARRIWRQLILIEDAMLVYRVVRAPERRVFYIDVANVPPQEVPQYVEQQRTNLHTAPVVDRQTGRVDLRYNPMSVEEDYYIPVRGGESGTKIDTLAGGQNAAAVEDVAYIQKKLFAALKIPRAYLGYDELLSSKATLAQEDIRFSRTINVIQKTMMAELNKLAIIHLYAHGFDGDDLQNFVLRLSNPSTVAQQQKLELWRAKFEIAGSAPEGMGSKEFIRKEIWGLNEEQIKQIDDQRLKEKLIDATIEGAGGEGGGEGADDLFGGGDEGGGDEMGGAGTEPADAGTGGSAAPPEENAGEEPEEETTKKSLITGGDDNDNEESFALKLNGIQDKPVKVSSHLDHALYNRGRRRTHGPSKTHMPDFAKMTGIDNHSMEDPFDNDWIKSAVSNPFGEAAQPTESSSKTRRLSSDVMSMLGRMQSKLHPEDNNHSIPSVIVEGQDVQDEIDMKSQDPTSINLIEDNSLSPRSSLNENEVLIDDESDVEYDMGDDE